MKDQPYLETSPKVSDEVKQTTCYMCACRCGINVHLKDGKVAYIEGNKDHPVNQGVLCAKGSAGIMQVNAPSRLDSPMIRVGPRGSGTSLRRLFVQGNGLNSSFAIHQDFTGNARDRVIALGIGVGSGYLFETTFKKEVYSDLTGERGTLMGAIQGLFAAQYSILRKKGHSPSEAFNETVEEATQSLYPLVAENGMDWMYANCSTTAQRGALDWWKKFRDAVYPVFEDLYNSVESGEEARITIKANKKSDYREGLDKELAELKDSELWKTGSEVRKLRP